MLVKNPRLLEVFLDGGMKREFQQWCKQNDITMSQQVRRLIKAHLAENGIEAPYKAPDSFSD